MIAFIDDHREAHGVEPICKVLPVAPSTYYDHVPRRRDPARLSARAKPGYGSQGRGPTRLRRELPCLRPAQGVAANCSGKASMSLAALLSG